MNLQKARAVLESMSRIQTSQHSKAVIVENPDFTVDEIGEALNLAQDALLRAAENMVGHIVQVPVQLTIAVRGAKTEQEAFMAADEFTLQNIQRLADCNHGDGWIVNGVSITEVSLERLPSDEAPTLIDVITKGE